MILKNIFWDFVIIARHGILLSPMQKEQQHYMLNLMYVFIVVTAFRRNENSYILVHLMYCIL